ncbi:MAG: tryptophan-rich sensory protein [Acholeplasma sp.]|jgi:hypothetical protein|nr:MAG: tryptophan-rich sensory protein [Acholeplasma sp.]
MTQFQHQSMIIVAALFFVFVIVMNVHANSLPLGGVTTGAVSYRYPNLFQPSGMTFSIWGLIYILLGWYTIGQLTTLNIPLAERIDQTFYINLFFSISSVFNILWLLSWHYDRILLSMFMMIFLLVSLLLATHYAFPIKGVTSIAFSVYLGWITVATIANATILLVSLGVPSFSNLSIILTIGILIVGVIIGSWFALKGNNLAYALVLLWAYFGIFIRHQTQESLTQSYPQVFYSVSGLMIFLFIINLVIGIRILK